MELKAQLSQVVHLSRVHTSPLYRFAYANDASYFRLVPQAVVQPDSIDEIQALFEFTQRHQISMTFRAAGTSLSGQAVTDGILVDVSKHWGRYNIEEDALLIRTQPGIVGGFLNKVLKPLGRRIGPDPASIDACMMGGILANNSSGMCCGVTENAYRTIHSMTFVLPNGLVIDTADPKAAMQFHEGAPEIERGLLELKKRLLAAGVVDKAHHTEHKGRKDDLNLRAPGVPDGSNEETLAERVRRRYQMKNNNGYLLNAFLDFEAPLDILVHLLIGSEGTLGFIAEAVLHTLPDYPRRYTGQLYFKNIQDAASAIAPLKESGARAAEIMDRAALRSVENNAGVPSVLKQLPDGAAAILVEYQAQDAETILQFRKEAEHVVKGLRLLHSPEFTDDPVQQAALWKPRKGIIPSVGATRSPGTISINEDVVFPVARLAEAVTDLQHLFVDFGFPDSAIFGHAKDGNLHFLINHSFDTEDNIQRFDQFIRATVKTVSGKYDGALKAEHGTGRNMAPIVTTEWGTEAYAIMRDLKALLDPSNMLNPNVIINPDPEAHKSQLKTMALVTPEVDKCIECGFCESRCPSNYLTLSPRQRIVVQRELAHLRLVASDLPKLASISNEFTYAGMATCAADGLCSLACPVNINTADLTKYLRAASVSPRGKRVALWLAEHFSFTESGLGLGVRMGHFAEALIGTDGVTAIIKSAEKLAGMTLPKWNAHIPSVTGNLPKNISQEAADFIYFPSCISRQLGTPKNDSRLSLAETLVTLAGRAQVNLYIPKDISGSCCGMPFNSKGYTQAHQAVLHKTIQHMWAWSKHGQLPMVIDTTSCTHTLRTCFETLSPEDKEIWPQLTLLDSLEFLHDVILPKLQIHPLDEEVILHPNCSAQRLGLQEKLLNIARRCAHTATIPVYLGCCGFAGDRGLLLPELTKSATQKESAEVNTHAYDGYYSSNITCEIGMSEATGRDYVAIAYLIERASR